MALFDKQNLKAVVSIGIEKNGKYSSLATGFLIGFMSEKGKDPSENEYKIFLVTNRHVFKDRDRVWLRFDKGKESGAKTFSVDLEVGGEKRWLWHKNDKVDLAMLTISPRFLDKHGIDWNFIPEEFFANHKNFKEIGIAPGDEIFIVGFPLQLIGEAQNYALVRSGILSRIDDEIVDKIKAFLVDASIFPGNSGGPVFLKPAWGSLKNAITVNRAYLLGTVSGYLNYKQEFYNPRTTPPSIGAISIENSGIGLVVPIDFAEEIYSIFIKEKKRLEEEEKGREKAIKNPELLMLKCRKCDEEFNSGIAMDRASFKTTMLKGNKHQCPYCKKFDVYNKKDYFYQNKS